MAQIVTLKVDILYGFLLQFVTLSVVVPHFFENLFVLVELNDMLNFKEKEYDDETAQKGSDKAEVTDIRIRDIVIRRIGKNGDRIEKGVQKSIKEYGSPLGADDDGIASAQSFTEEEGKQTGDEKGRCDHIEGIEQKGCVGIGEYKIGDDLSEQDARHRAHGVADDVAIQQGNKVHVEQHPKNQKLRNDGKAVNNNGAELQVNE